MLMRLIGLAMLLAGAFAPVAGAAERQLPAEVFAEKMAEAVRTCAATFGDDAARARRFASCIRTCNLMQGDAAHECMTDCGKWRDRFDACVTSIAGPAIRKALEQGQPDK